MRNPAFLSLFVSILMTLLSPSTGVCEDSISPETLSKLKNATVLIKVSSGSASSIGTGFVV